jgi:hypothetical protein
VSGVSWRHVLKFTQQRSMPPVSAAFALLGVGETVSIDQHPQIRRRSVCEGID